MRKQSTKITEAFKRLEVVQREDRGLVLEGTRQLVQTSVLAPDLFRFRATGAGNFSARPSWSVCRTDWPATKVQISEPGQVVRIRTGNGAITLSKATGALQLYDASGTLLFDTAPEATGFSGGRPCVTVRLSGGESFFGMGESSGPFDRRGLIQKFWNTDTLGHGGINPGLRNLYVSIPFAVMMRNGTAAGLFWDNPSRQEWDLGQTCRHRWQMQADSGEIDLYLFTGRNVSDIVQRYSELTGHMPMPPRWALGYHQSRYSYESRKELERIASRFRKHRIPCDAFYLDIHHMDGYRVFTFGKTFPNPAEMIRKLRRQGFRTVAIADPGVKLDKAFGVYQRGKRINAFVRTSDGKHDYAGKVWPGRSVFPDFLNQKVRQWWGREQSKLHRTGLDGFWNDMNEPADFASSTKTLPEGCRHNSDSGPMRHAEAHNLYGMQMARASQEGALNHRPNERPFIITRAAYAGTQRHALLWTGDNASSWEHLADSVQMLLNLGVSGFPFCGCDAGGFLDNCTPELYMRWMQAAAFTPFFRNHTTLNSLSQEPWAFGARVESIVRSHIELRYQLLPYLYCLFAEAHRTGTPIMRPLFWHHQDDPVAVACGDQFLLGQSLLAAPIMRQGATARSVYLPAGAWFDFWTGRRHRGGRHVVAEAPLDRLPLFVRGGSIIPTCALQQHTGEGLPSVINLHIWPGSPGKLDWHEDDGHSMNYLNSDFCSRSITMKRAGAGIELRFHPATGSFRSRVKQWRVIVHATSRKFRVSGAKAKTRFDSRQKPFAMEMKNPPCKQMCTITLRD